MAEIIEKEGGKNEGEIMTMMRDRDRQTRRETETEKENKRTVWLLFLLKLGLVSHPKKLINIVNP